MIILFSLVDILYSNSLHIFILALILIENYPPPPDNITQSCFKIPTVMSEISKFLLQAFEMNDSQTCKSHRSLFKADVLFRLRISHQAQSSFSMSPSGCFISSYQCEWKHKFLRKLKNSQPGHHLVFINYTLSNSIQSTSKSLKAPIYQFAVGKDRVPHSQAPPRFWPTIWSLLSHTRRYSHTLYSPTQNASPYTGGMGSVDLKLHHGISCWLLFIHYIN